MQCLMLRELARRHRLVVSSVDKLWDIYSLHTAKDTLKGRIVIHLFTKTVRLAPPLKMALQNSPGPPINSAYFLLKRGARESGELGGAISLVAPSVRGPTVRPAVYMKTPWNGTQVGVHISRDSKLTRSNPTSPVRPSIPVISICNTAISRWAEQIKHGIFYRSFISIDMLYQQHCVWG